MTCYRPRDCFVLAIQDLQNFVTAVCFSHSKSIAVGLRGDPQSFYICEVSILEFKFLYKKNPKPHFFQCKISASLCLPFGSFIPRQRRNDKRCTSPCTFTKNKCRSQVSLSQTEDQFLDIYHILTVIDMYRQIDGQTDRQSDRQTDRVNSVNKYGIQIIHI